MSIPNERALSQAATTSSSSYGFNVKMTHLSLPFIVSKVQNVYSGYADKQSSWFLAHWFPFFFQLWKPRYLVIVGNYLLRYENEDSLDPKGKPIPLDVSDVRIDENNKTELLIFNLWKDYKFRFSSEEECVDWSRALKNRKYEAIRENMNHVPVSESVALVNKAASRKIESFMKSIDTTSSQGRSSNSVEIYNPLSSYTHNNNGLNLNGIS